MRVAVTGGAGFIGSHLCAALNKSGARVAAWDAFRPASWPKTDPAALPVLRDRRERLLSGTELGCLDLLDRPELEAALGDFNPECVVHLAGEPIVSTAQKNIAQASQDILQSTANLLAAVVATNSVRRLVLISSSMVYGHFTAAMVAEDAPVMPVNSYGVLKTAAEDLVRTVLGATGTEFVIIRPTGVYGPNDVHARVVNVLCRRALSGTPLTVNTGPDSIVDFTHVDDLVAGIAAACTRPEAAGETFNLSYGEARRVMDVANILREHLPELHVLELGASDPRRPRRGALDISKARRLLGFAPSIRLEEGIGHCLTYLRDVARADGSPALPLVHEAYHG